MGFSDKLFWRRKNQEENVVAQKLEQVEKSSPKPDFGTIRGLFVSIMEDEKLKEKIGAVCSIDFITELQPLTSLGSNFSCSLDGNIFAQDGCGGYYVLLEDNSIGYIGFSENECGRVAINLQELLELELNCAYSWHNYGLEYAKLNGESVLAFEETGREQFKDAYALTYDEVRNEISKILNLHVSTDILSEILPKFYRSATLEPKFTATNGERKMNDLII